MSRIELLGFSVTCAAHLLSRRFLLGRVISFSPAGLGPARKWKQLERSHQAQDERSSDDGSRAGTCPTAETKSFSV